MRIPLYWTDNAIISFQAIVDLIESNWGEKETRKFVKRTNKVLDNIASQPYLYKASTVDNVRQGIISKQTSLFYEIFNNSISLLFFYDNRQEPFI
jgi:plasmid stabilization system protein ParE